MLRLFRCLLSDASLNDLCPFQVECFPFSVSLSSPLVLSFLRLLSLEVLTSVLLLFRSILSLRCFTNAVFFSINRALLPLVPSLSTYSSMGHSWWIFFFPYALVLFSLFFLFPLFFLFCLSFLFLFFILFRSLCPGPLLSGSLESMLRSLMSCKDANQRRLSIAQLHASQK